MTALWTHSDAVTVPDHAVVIVNPKAGAHRRAGFETAMAHLRTQIATVDILKTDHPRHAAALARAAADVAPLVIAAGGDGTIAEVVDGLTAAVPLASRSSSAPLLGILPVGTANVLAAELGITSCETAVDRILSGSTRQVRFGFVQSLDPDAGIPRRPFMSMVGAGFDADVVATVPSILKDKLGKGAYALMALYRLLQPCPRGLLVRIDGGDPVALASIVVCNTHYYGGRFVLAPDAKTDDTMLRACLFKSAGRWAALRYIVAMVSGRMGALPPRDYAVVPAGSVEIVANATPGAANRLSAVQADGDHIGALPVRIWAAPFPLSVAA